MTTLTTPQPTPVDVPARAPGRPKAALFAAIVQILFGLLTAPAGFFFSLSEGGGWAAIGAPLFAVAMPLWIYGGIGTLRGSHRGHRVGVGMLVAMTAFGVYKIAWVHETVSWGFQAVTLLAMWAQLSSSVRVWVRG